MRLSAILFTFFSLSSLICRADDLSVVDVRSNIPLSEEEPAYKDFYIAGGDVSSLKKNLVVTALRKITIRDSKGAQAYGDIAVPVGQLKVIAVYGKVAVAREYKLLSRDENPTLEQVGIMSGDQIDLKESFIDSAKPTPKKKTAELTKPEPMTMASVIPAAQVAVRVAASEMEISRPEISRPEMSESGTSVYGAPAAKKADPAALVEEPSAPAASSKKPASVPAKSPATLEEDEEPAHHKASDDSFKPVPVFKPVDHLPTGDE